MGWRFTRARRLRGCGSRKNVRHPAMNWLWLANALVFPKIRAKMVGAKLEGANLWSAPLNPETQLYF